MTHGGLRTTNRAGILAAATNKRSAFGDVRVLVDPVMALRYSHAIQMTMRDERKHWDRQPPAIQQCLKGLNVQDVKFHSEQPSKVDAFPGESHRKVATAICNHLLSNDSSRIIGLDGEFGSGKSSILQMIKEQLTERESKYKVWLFDCEQNFQGSIKSNFIELFTEELITTAGNNKEAVKHLEKKRDIALGREFTYRKNTTSRVSAWAALLIISVFFSSSSFKELLTLSDPSVTPGIEFLVFHLCSFISPLLILAIAKFVNRKKMIGNQKWTFLNLFKGSSEDYINEKIEVSREVTPLDLKRTLSSQLEMVSAKDYIVVLDNLDRLPRESLRTVWSDLEIFTWLAEEKNLTIIVPFCSTKVANSLGSEQDGKYDSKDFIAKKFPVVFRAPPVITSGWKATFLDLWKHTFGEDPEKLGEKCALILQKHSPMAGGLVTPRLQKRFINDVATTASILGSHVNLVCIGAHVLLCKYNEYPLTEVLKTGDASKQFSEKFGTQAVSDLESTGDYLKRVFGEDINNGWQIQFLQAHYLTTSVIAVAELLDEPLSRAIDQKHSEGFSKIAGLFGFPDAVKRYLESKPEKAPEFLILLADAYKYDQDEKRHLWLSKLIDTLNHQLVDVHPGENTKAPEFYKAINALIASGLKKELLQQEKRSLLSYVSDAVKEDTPADSFDFHRYNLAALDSCLNALGEDFETIETDKAAYIAHIVLSQKNLLVIKPEHFTINDAGLREVHLQLASSENLPLDCTPLESDLTLELLEHAYGNRKIALGVKHGLHADVTSALLNNYIATPESYSAAIGVMLIGKPGQKEVDGVFKPHNASPTLLSSIVAVVICLRTGNYSRLNEFDNLIDVFHSDIFKLMAKAALESKMFLAALEQEAAIRPAAEFLVWAINNRAISHLNWDQIAINYQAIIEALEQEGLSEEDFLRWLSAWSTKLDVLASKLDDQCIHFVRQIFDNETQGFNSLREKSVEHLDSADRTSEEWASIIRNPSAYIVVLEYMARHSHFLSSTDAPRKALLEELAPFSKDRSYSLPLTTLTNLNSLLSVMERPVKNVIGAELRTISFAGDADPEQVAHLLEEFGEIIPDIQPASSAEVGTLLKLLEYLTRNTETRADAISFLNSRAQQISGYEYSEEFKEALGEVLISLAERAPDLYKQFERKKGFKAFLPYTLKKLIASKKSEEQEE